MLITKGYGLLGIIGSLILRAALRDQLLAQEQIVKACLTALVIVCASQQVLH